MALTVNLKPSGFRPVGGGSLIYKFTESSLAGKTNYRVEIELNGLGLPKFDFRPDSALVIEADIAPILRAALLLSASTADRFKNTYVKYQAVWNESSDGQVSLSSDVIYFYPGNNYYLNNRTKFHCSLGDSKTGAEVLAENYPVNNVSLIHLHPTSEADATYHITPNNTHYAWLGKEFVYEFLHDNSFSSNCQVSFINPTGGGPAATAFAGNAYAMRQVTFTPDVVGQWIVAVQDVTNAKYMLWDRITVLPDCGGFHIQWLNDYGGLERFMFETSQESFQFSTNEKYLTRVLYADKLTLSQWRMFHEILSEGQIYNSDRRIGKFIQGITSLSSPNNIVVSPVAGIRRLEQVGHSIALSARYPAIPNNEV